MRLETKTKTYETILIFDRAGIPGKAQDSDAKSVSTSEPSFHLLQPMVQIDECGLACSLREKTSGTGRTMLSSSKRVVKGHCKGCISGHATRWAAYHDTQTRKRTYMALPCRDLLHPR